MNQDFGIEAEVERILEELGVEPPNEQSFRGEMDIALASDFANELLDLFDQFTRSAERDLPRHWDRSDRRCVAREQAMVGISAMVIEMTLQYPDWASTLLDRIVERRDLTERNGRALRESFPDAESRLG